MRNLFLVIGLAALALGLIWIGQGTGTVHLPQASFGIDALHLKYHGAGLAAAGLVLIFVARRRRDLRHKFL